MKIKSKLLNMTLLSGIVFATSGCVTGAKYSNASVTIEPTSENVFTEIENIQQKVELKKNNKFISVKNKSVSSILSALSTNKTHVLVGKDLILKKSNYKVTTLGELQKYIKMFTDYKLIKLNETNDLVEWKLVNLKINKFTRGITKLDLNGDVVVNDILVTIGKNLNYNIIINNDIKDELQKKIFINFRGNTAEDFLNYIQNYMNIYYKIDKTSKNIEFFKYKELNYDLHTLYSNRSYYVDTANKNDKIKSIINMKVNQYDDLENYLKNVIKGKNSFHIQKATGTVYIKVDYLTNKSVEKIMEEYKENLNRHIDIIISKEQVLMSDKEYSSFDFKKNTRILKNRLVEKEKIALSLVNGVPTYNDNSFIKYIKTKNGMKEINYGSKIIVNAKTFLHDDRIIVEINDDTTDLIGITKDKDNNEYPEIKTHSYNSIVNMKSGEQKIIDSKILKRKIDGNRNNLIEFTVVKIIK